MTLIGSCFAQSSNTPLSTPANIEYPGILQTFEKLIQVDATKFKNRTEILSRNGKSFNDAASVTSLELEPDFLNSLILHSDPGYIRLASSSKCRFYDTILTDLLKSAEGKIKNVMVTYVNPKGERESALISKKDFLNKVVNQECPETTKLINEFQIKTLDQTLASTLFEIPTGKDQCRNLHLSWVNNPKTPFLCQIHEYINEVKKGGGDPKDLPQRQAISNILNQKLNLIQKDYIANLCNHLDQDELFCSEFLNVSIWSKIAGGYENKIYAEDICRKVLNLSEISNAQLKECLARLKKENDLCLYTGGRGSSLSPQLECDSLSFALNHSSLRSDYQDCPGSSDQLAITNLSRILLDVTKDPIKSVNGPCSAISSGVALEFNEQFENLENWNLEACYDDKINEKEVCHRTFFGSYGNHPASYTNIVATILKATRGADKNLTCTMIDDKDYNPLLLQYKSGCYVMYDRNNCYMSQCKHKILYNDRSIDFIKIKNRLTMDYFPLTVQNERYSQHFLLTREMKKKARALNNLTAVTSYFKKSRKATIYGVGCAEDILPSFFKSLSLNQCTPLPFIVDGMIKDGESQAFVTRTAADSLQAPRLINWSNLYSSVKTYQRLHPMKIWTLYGLD